MDLWKRFYNDFKALMEEEDRIVRQRELRDWFHVDVIYEESGEFGSWSFASSATESLKARFELLATEAGIALGSPPETSPYIYWLHRLFIDLRANNSQHLRIYNDAGGTIERLLEASATYCVRLNRQSLDNAVASNTDEEGAGERSEGRSAVATPILKVEPIKSAQPASDNGVGLEANQAAQLPVKDVHLDLLEMILKKNATTLEKWARRHRLARTTVFDWKSCRRSGKSYRGKVSSEKSGEIQKAIENDAAELGLTTRTNSD
jgi:hypothetical protein